MGKEAWAAILTYAVLIGVLAGWTIYNEKNTQVVEYCLLGQWLDNLTPADPTLKPCNNCLIMWVAPVTSAYDADSCLAGDYERFSGRTETIFFAGEHRLREDLRVPSLIYARWCKVDGRWFVRGVWEVENT